MQKHVPDDSLKSLVHKYDYTFKVSLHEGKPKLKSLETLHSAFTANFNENFSITGDKIWTFFSF